MLRSTMNRYSHPAQVLPRWCDVNQHGASSQRVRYPGKTNTADKQTNHKPMYLSTHLPHNDARTEWSVLLYCDLLYRAALGRRECNCPWLVHCVLSRRLAPPPGMLDVRPRFLIDINSVTFRFRMNSYTFWHDWDLSATASDHTHTWCIFAFPRWRS